MICFVLEHGKAGTLVLEQGKKIAQERRNAEREVKTEERGDAKALQKRAPNPRKFGYLYVVYQLQKWYSDPKIVYSKYLHNKKKRQLCTCESENQDAVEYKKFT